MKSSEHGQSYLETLLQSYNESPIHCLLGLEIRHYDRGVASAAMPVKPKLFNASGAVDQSCLAALGTAAAEFAVSTLVADQRQTVVMEQRLSILAATHTGRLVAKAKVDHLRARIAQSRFRIYDNEGEVVASGGAIIYVLPREQKLTNTSKEVLSLYDEATSLDEQAFFYDETLTPRRKP